MSFFLSLAESGLIPDALLSHLMQLYLRARLRRGMFAGIEMPEEAHLVQAPLELFERMLGKHLYYNCGYWPTGTYSLGEAEEQMLSLICKHAQIEDGQNILELGCRWGAVSLWIAERYKNSKILAVSNSRERREYVELQARQRGLTNLEVIDIDFEAYGAKRRYDRVLATHIFEQTKKYKEMMFRISAWVGAEGKLFAQVLTHMKSSYVMGWERQFANCDLHALPRQIIPSDELLLEHNQSLKLEERWNLPGKHFEKTLAAWSANLESSKAALLSVLARSYGEAQPELWFRRWKLYLLMNQATFGLKDGQEFQVSQYLFCR